MRIPPSRRVRFVPGWTAMALASVVCAGFLATAHAREKATQDRSNSKKTEAAPTTGVSEKKEAPRRETSTEPRARSNQSWWMNRHEAIVDRVKRGRDDIELLMIGDSITQGWEGKGKDVWARYYAPRNAANLGIGGDQTQHVLWRLEHGEIDGVHPKAAVIMIGTNNLGGHSNDEIVAGVQKIVCVLRAKLPETKILLLGIFPRQDRKTAEDVAKTLARIASINARLARLADGKSVRYLDIGYVFVEPEGIITREMMPDLLHLSSDGYRRWADAIEPTLWTLLNE